MDEMCTEIEKVNEMDTGNEKDEKNYANGEKKRISENYLRTFRKFSLSASHHNR